MNSLHFLIGQLLIVAVVIWAVRQERAAPKLEDEPSHADTSTGHKSTSNVPEARVRRQQGLEELDAMPGNGFGHTKNL
jgi:hypothetical protein